MPKAKVNGVTPVDYGPNGGGSRKIAELMPNSHLVPLSDAGHTHLFQQPRETVDAIFTFIDGVRQPSLTL